MDEIGSLLERTAGPVEVRPDLWERVVVRRRSRQRAARIVSIVVAAAVVAGAGTTLAVAFRPGRAVPTIPPPAGTPLSVTVHALGTPGTCTASIGSSVVSPGQALTIHYAVRNQGPGTLAYQGADIFAANFGR